MMIREEYLAVAGVYFERTLFSIKDIPDDRLEWPLADREESALDLISGLAARGERMVRALELLFQGSDPADLLATPLQKNADMKRAIATFKITHSTILAALERIPASRFAYDGEVPPWLLDEYLNHVERAATRIEAWAQSLRARGQAGPTGLPVMQ